MSDLHRELATLRLSPADLQSSLAQAAKEAEEEQRNGELCALRAVHAVRDVCCAAKEAEQECRKGSVRCAGGLACWLLLGW